MKDWLEQMDVLAEDFEKKNKDFDPEKDYCSWSPDIIFGVSIKRSCYKHDKGCDAAVTKEEKKLVDKTLRRDIFLLGDAAGKFKTFFLVSLVYFRGVRGLISRFFFWKKYLS